MSKQKHSDLLLHCSYYISATVSINTLQWSDVVSSTMFHVPFACHVAVDPSSWPAPTPQFDAKNGCQARGLGCSMDSMAKFLALGLFTVTIFTMAVQSKGSCHIMRVVITRTARLRIARSILWWMQLDNFGYILCNVQTIRLGKLYELPTVYSCNLLYIYINKYI